MSPDEQAHARSADLRSESFGAGPQVHGSLGPEHIGELLRKTGDDLLECKNFGVTSLNEVREKLTSKG